MRHLERRGFGRRGFACKRRRLILLVVCVATLLTFGTRTSPTLLSASDWQPCWPCFRSISTSRGLMGLLFAICSTIVSVMDAGALLLSLFLDKRIYFQWSSQRAHRRLVRQRQCKNARELHSRDRSRTSKRSVITFFLLARLTVTRRRLP